MKIFWEIELQIFALLQLRSKHPPWLLQLPLGFILIPPTPIVFIFSTSLPWKCTTQPPLVLTYVYPTMGHHPASPLFLDQE